MSDSWYQWSTCRSRSCMCSPMGKFCRSGSQQVGLAWVNLDSLNLLSRAILLNASLRCSKNKIHLLFDASRSGFAYSCIHSYSVTYWHYRIWGDSPLFSHDNWCRVCLLVLGKFLVVLRTCTCLIFKLNYLQGKRCTCRRFRPISDCLDRFCGLCRPCFCTSRKCKGLRRASVGLRTECKLLTSMLSSFECNANQFVYSFIKCWRFTAINTFFLI